MRLRNQRYIVHSRFFCIIIRNKYHLFIFYLEYTMNRNNNDNGAAAEKIGGNAIYNGNNVNNNNGEADNSVESSR